MDFCTILQRKEAAEKRVLEGWKKKVPPDQNSIKQQKIGKGFLGVR
jgi:hypothetical protein